MEFEKIYREHFGTVYKYLLHLCRNTSLADELAQETFFRAMRSLDKFDGRCQVDVWLCQIAKNTYISICRKEKHLDHDTDTGLLVSSQNIEDKYLSRESAFEIHKILHKLPEPYKEVFSLRAFGELSYEQIAELFGKTETWARVTYHRARLKIKEELK